MTPHDLFDVPGPGPYLFSHSVGCLPRGARAALAEQLLNPWSTEGSDGWPAWLAGIDRFRTALATLLGGVIEEVCPQPSVSAALGVFLSGLPRAPGRNVLLASAHAFPTVAYVMDGLQPLGFRLELLPEDRNPADPQVWADAIGPEVAAVVPMHVHSNSGLVSPVRDIATLARAAGAICVVDACQSVGILPVTPHEWGVDALVASCVKWLCGGPGAAFLWVRHDLIGQVDPVARGWFSHADPMQFDIRDFRYADDARRFWGGTPAPAPCILGAAGIETVLGIGFDAVLAANRKLIGAAEAAASVKLDVSGRGGTLCLTGDDPDAAEQALRQIGCRFDRRGRIIRLSFSVWNNDEQARAVGQLIGAHHLRLV